LQFDNSTNALEIRALQSPKRIHVLLFVPRLENFA
jgi:hypothetical protein